MLNPPDLWPEGSYLNLVIGDFGSLDLRICSQRDGRSLGAVSPEVSL